MASKFLRGVRAIACSATLCVTSALPAPASAAIDDGVIVARDPARAAAPLPVPLVTVGGDAADVAIGRGPLLLQFWASWCHSCGGLMWELDGLSAAHPRVPYYAISIDDDRADAARITTHALHARHPARFLHDHEGALARRLAIQAVPAIVLLDAAGHERLRHVGHVNSSDLQRLRRALADLSTTPSPSETTP